MWQPIETAPMDETIFIALSPLGISRCQWTEVDWGEHPLDPVHYWWSDPDEKLYFEDGPHDAPTHWMPEPSAPVRPVCDECGGSGFIHPTINGRFCQPEPCPSCGKTSDKGGAPVMSDLLQWELDTLKFLWQTKGDDAMREDYIDAVHKGIAAAGYKIVKAEETSPIRSCGTCLNFVDDLDADNDCVAYPGGLECVKATYSQWEPKTSASGETLEDKRREQCRQAAKDFQVVEDEASPIRDKETGE